MDDILSLCQNPAARLDLLQRRQRLAMLLDRGVQMPCPETVEVGPEVVLDQIAPGVVLHAGTKLLGAKTSLGPGVRLGLEGPVTLVDCVLGPDVVLDGGFFQGATFLDRANARSWAHMREGTLLEEEASVAHCVGLKQTILFPYATLGSLINFCDCLLAGGTSRKNHSEVGSGYIHFNFTPRGDKATPSLFGDVPRGVLLDQPRIFLGGLAATVGPLSVGYGAFLGPGQVYRKDVGPNGFVLGEPPLPPELLSREQDFDPQVLSGLGRRLKKNVLYLGNLVALHQWYHHVRALFAGGAWQTPYASAQALVAGAIHERLNQLDKLMKALPESILRLKQRQPDGRAVVEQTQLWQSWPALREGLGHWNQLSGDGSQRDRLLEGLSRAAGPGRYLPVVQGMSPALKQAAQAWLESLIQNLTRDTMAMLPAR